MGERDPRPRRTARAQGRKGARRGEGTEETRAIPALLSLAPLLPCALAVSPPASPSASASRIVTAHRGPRALTTAPRKRVRMRLRLTHGDENGTARVVVSSGAKPHRSDELSRTYGPIFIA